MPRLLLKFSLLITIALTITSLAARVLGSTQPPNPALRGFTEGCEDKPQPCWYGIVPGVTTFEEAKNVIGFIGYKERQSHGIEILDNVILSFSLQSSMCPFVSIIAENDIVVSIEISYECRERELQIGNLVVYAGIPNNVLVDFGNLDGDSVVREIAYGGEEIDYSGCWSFTDEYWKMTIKALRNSGNIKQNRFLPKRHAWKLVYCPQ